MNIIHNEIDSKALQKTVLALRELSPDADLAAIEKEYVEAHLPGYVEVKVPIEEVALIHDLESLGFRFVECQFKMSYKLKETFETKSFPYDFELVETEEDLQPVLAIAKETFVADRFSIDPLLPPQASGQRYEAYVRRSMKVDDEEVYRLRNQNTGEVVAFKTHRILNQKHVLLLLGGTKSEYKKTGIATINEYFELNDLKARGFRKVYTHISARNYPIVNLEVKGFGFRVLQSFIVLRKIYTS